MPGILSATPRQVRGFAGDDFWYSFTLYEDGSPFNLSGSTVTVGVRDEAQVDQITPVVQSSSSTGANWASGILIVNIPNAQTIPLFQGRYFFEIQVLLSTGLYKTWPLIPIDLEQYSVYTH